MQSEREDENDAEVNDHWQERKEDVNVVVVVLGHFRKGQTTNVHTRTHSFLGNAGNYLL